MQYRLYTHNFFNDNDKLALIGSGEQLQRIELITDTSSLDPSWQEQPDYQSALCKQLDIYLSGEPVAWNAYELSGTEMQQAVWNVIASIPYGETISYTELAKRAGKPSAVRAAASACGKNPIPLIIPCHRIIGKDGGLGGFSLGGLHYKKKLLALEQATHAKAA